jgi:hypothetical protein
MDAFFGNVQAGSLAPATLAYLASSHDGANLNTYTFPGMAMGVASPTRQIMVGVAATDSSYNPATGVTVGGVAATKRVGSGSGSFSVAEIWQVSLPTGTVADVVVTFGGQAQTCSVYIFAGDKLVSNVPVDTGAAQVADPVASVIDITAGGFAIAIAAAWDGVTAAWNGLTEKDDTAVDTTRSATCATDVFGSSFVNRVVSCDFSGASNSNQALAVASWR